MGSLSRKSFHVTTQWSVISNPVCKPCVLSVCVTMTSADRWIWFCGLCHRKHWSLATALFTILCTVHLGSKTIFFLSPLKITFFTHWNYIVCFLALWFRALVIQDGVLFSMFLLPTAINLSYTWPISAFVWLNLLDVCAGLEGKGNLTLLYKGNEAELQQHTCRSSSTLSSVLHSSANMNLLLALLGAALCSFVVYSEVQPQADFSIQAVRQISTVFILQIYFYSLNPSYFCILSSYSAYSALLYFMFSILYLKKSDVCVFQIENKQKAWKISCHVMKRP